MDSETAVPFAAAVNWFASAVPSDDASGLPSTVASPRSALCTGDGVAVGVGVGVEVGVGVGGAATPTVVRVKNESAGTLTEKAPLLTGTSGPRSASAVALVR